MNHIKRINDVDVEEVSKWQNVMFVVKAFILETTLAIPIEEATQFGSLM